MIEEFKARCSAIGNIMADPDKNIMPKGAKTYCRDWLKGQLFNRQVSMSTKGTRKGNRAEDEAIDFAADILEWGPFVTKNKKSFNDDPDIKGTPDVLRGKVVADIKCPWTWQTFPYLTPEIPEKDYDWQLHGYMALTGCERAELVYVLMDASEEEIFQEARSRSYAAGQNGDTAEFFEAVQKEWTYGDLHPKMRVKVYDIERSEKVIEQIRARVKLCREYIKEITPKEIYTLQP